MLNSEYHLRTLNGEKSIIIAALGKVILHKNYLKDRPESTMSAKQNKKLRGVIEHNVQDHDLTLTAP